MKKIILITGGSRGIGLGIAKCLAGENCNLVINGTRETSAVVEPLEALRALGAEVLYCRADVSNPVARKAMLTEIRNRFGRLDGLVNNAGVAPKVRADILEATEDSFERLIRINLQGPYFLTQAVAGWMIEQKKSTPNRSPLRGFAGCIVNISSISATVASPDRGDYCLSKAAVGMATKLWAVRLAEFGIGVYEVRPGIIRTDMTAGVGAKYDKLISEGLLLQRRWGVPEDVGRAVAALVRGDLAYSTGQVIQVDGGQYI